jgi:hypothetical protein
MYRYSSSPHVRLGVHGKNTVRQLASWSLDRKTFEMNFKRITLNEFRCRRDPLQRLKSEVILDPQLQSNVPHLEGPLCKCIEQNWNNANAKFYDVMNGVGSEARSTFDEKLHGTSFSFVSCFNGKEPIRIRIFKYWIRNTLNINT